LVSIVNYENEIQKRIYAHKKGNKQMQIYIQFRNIYAPSEKKIISIVE